MVDFFGFDERYDRRKRRRMKEMRSHHMHQWLGSLLGLAWIQRSSLANELAACGHENPPMEPSMTNLSLPSFVPLPDVATSK
jgi:hypothetical protein